MKNYLLPVCLSMLLTLGLTYDLSAQRKKKKDLTLTLPTETYEASLFQAMKWRNVGPFRGGRSTTVCGVPTQPYTFYMGSVGGGVWKTEDGGGTWRNISDGHLKTGSVGSIAVAPSDPNVVYVGMGEAPIRGVMTSHGDGVYKSTDGGKTWEHIGLSEVRHISKIRIHPENPDVVFIGAQGSPYQATQERGVFRSIDGGASWEKVLFVDENSGVSDLSMDMNNPRVLYAAFWDHQRLPWKMRSGGEGSGIWKSVDGGSSWEELSKGLPEGIMGKIGVVVSPAQSSRVYAIIEAEKGGMFRSDDGGKTWKRMNEDRILRARSWYYMHIFADPKNPDKVVVLNAPFMQSTDGGKTFTRIMTPHGDNHDLWIHPENPEIMINANDGGANISYNGGRTWSTQANQPTAQFYRVNADNRFPYWVYGGQQDNSTVAIPNRTFGRGIQNADFHSVGGCESAYCAFDPNDPRYVYAGCYQGIISRYDQELETGVDVMAIPFLGLGENPKDLPYRFNWNAPIHVSMHDPSVIYHAGNKVLMSQDKGQSWKEISPDLTRNDSSKIDWGGGPITNEGAGGENYHTIMALAESPHDAQNLWVGSDDGLVHLSRDGGDTWQEITPPGMDEGMVNAIEVSPHQAGKAYVAYTRYKFNDFSPHIFITEDYGTTWRERVAGIEKDAHVRVIREDPNRKELLYAGTETGLYISFDDGNSWNPFQNNLPIVPVTDIKVHQKDLVISTQGRAFWILDDLGSLHELHAEISQKDLHLFSPRDPYLVGGVRIDSLPDMGTNPDNGLVAYYLLKESIDSQDVTIDILSEEGALLRTYSSTEKVKSKKASKRAGQNKFVWDFRLPDYKLPKGIMSLGGNGGHRVGPGSYTMRLSYGSDTLTHTFKVLPDPRLELSETAFQEQQQLLSQVRSSLEELYESVDDIRHIRSQIDNFLGRKDWDSETLKQQAESLVEDMKKIESELVQEKQKTFQDVINFPNQLNAKLKHIQGIVEEAIPPVTEGQKKRVAEMVQAWEKKRGMIQSLMEKDLPELNQQIQALEVPFISSDISERTVN